MDSLLVVGGIPTAPHWAAPAFTFQVLLAPTALAQLRPTFATISPDRPARWWSELGSPAPPVVEPPFTFITGVGAGVLSTAGRNSPAGGGGGLEQAALTPTTCWRSSSPGPLH